MGAPEEFRAALIGGDFRKLRRISEQAEPHLERLSDAQAEILMHRARTEAGSVPVRLRLYSHRWLSERCIASGLPMELRPKGENERPTIAEGVGISVKANSAIMKSAAAIIRGRMEDAVSEAYASNRRDPVFVKTRIDEARAGALKELFGRISQGAR